MRRIAVLVVAILCAVTAVSCKRGTPSGRPPSPEERFRRSAAAEWSSACHLGVVWRNPTPGNEAAIRAAMTALKGQNISLLWIRSDFRNLEDTAMLLRTARANDIKVALAPAWADFPSDAAAIPAWLNTTAPALQRFQASLKPRPNAMAISETLSSEEAIGIFRQYQRTNTAVRMTTIGCIPPHLADAFIAGAPESATMACRLRLASNPSGTTNDYAAFIQDGTAVVRAALAGAVTPMALLGDNATREKPAPQIAWQAWAALAMGFKGVILAAPDLPSAKEPVPVEFKDIAAVRPVLGRLVKREDFTGLTPIRERSYPGDLTQLFFDPQAGQYLAAVVLSPMRPPAEHVTLRCGKVTPLTTSPALHLLRPGHGGLYQIPLNRETIAALNEASRLSAVPRHLRDELFVPTFGNRFSVLADETMTPRMLHSAEPVAVLIHPNIILAPLAGAGDLVVQDTRKAPAFHSAHVSGYTLYRIATTNRFQRMVILEENGSVPGYDLRASAIANVAVTNNGICPRPTQKGTARLAADQCHLQYDLDALRAVAGLNSSYPLYFQFDGGNTAGQLDKRFQVWSGPGPSKLTERLSPLQPVTLVFLSGEDKVLKIGMPYSAGAPTQPVLRRWSFFTWLRPAPAAKSR